MSEAPPPELTAALQSNRLRRGAFGEPLYFFAETGSTNDIAAALAQNGAPEGTTVVAGAQSAGRGRFGRQWFSPPGAGLYVSVICRTAAAAPLLTLAGGVAVADGIRSATGLPVHIKWPNDVVVEAGTPLRRRKLAGVLAEASTDADGLQHVILGFGINLRSAAFPPELADRATSVETELGEGTGDRTRAGGGACCVERSGCGARRGRCGRCPRPVAGARSIGTGGGSGVGNASRHRVGCLGRDCGRRSVARPNGRPDRANHLGGGAVGVMSLSPAAASADSVTEHKMLLAIDVGNTNIVLGVFDGERLAESWRLATMRERTADEAGILVTHLFERSRIPLDRVDGIILSSVVPPLTRTMEEMAERFFGRTPLTVDPGMNTGMPVLYLPASDVGADRVVNAVAAYEAYGRAAQIPVIVVDFGTATTFDAISATGEYIGGVICPGIGISADALFQRAARLPRVDVRKPPAVIGRTTVTSMQSGLFFGYVAMVDGIVARMRVELDKGESAACIATGGMASIIAGESTAIERVDPDLTLHGLRLVWARNSGAKS